LCRTVIDGGKLSLWVNRVDFTTFRTFPFTAQQRMSRRCRPSPLPSLQVFGLTTPVDADQIGNPDDENYCKKYHYVDHGVS